MLSFIDNWLRPLQLAAAQVEAELDLPDGLYVLTISDSSSSATRWEVFAAQVELGLGVLDRDDPQEWGEGSVVYCSVSSRVLDVVFSSLAAHSGRLETLENETSGPLVIIDELASTADLPATGEGGDAYAIAGHVWVWATGTDSWVDIGSYQGADGDDGEDGVPVELQASATHLQWRHVGDADWVDLLPLASLKGADGDDGEDGVPVELQASPTHLQWRHVGDADWVDLLPLSSLKGADGDDGEDGVPVELQASATHLQWRHVGDAEWIDLIPLSEITVSAGGWDALATPAISSGALVLDLSEPSLFAVTLDQNVTDLSFANLPAGKAPAFAIAFTQDASGGRTVTWPAGVIGTPPDIGTAAGAVTVVSLAYIGGGQYVISGAIYA